MHGPIESVDTKNGRVTVLGQSFQADSSAAGLTKLSEQLASGQTIAATVFGRMDTQGKLRADRFVPTSVSYVPGSSKVMVSGRATNVRLDSGTFTVGKVVVDYTALLSAATINIAMGDNVTVVGVQTALGAPLQAIAM